MHIPFTSSPSSSVGIEWELQLVDLETRELAPAATEILTEIGLPHGGEHPKAKNELFESTIEVITGVCHSISEGKADLAATVAEVAEAADRRGLGLVGAGSHPISSWQNQPISGNERYERLMTNMQWLARRLQIFGVHVHVGVRSPHKAIPILNALTTYIPHFLAISASSPYWVGCDTGLASSRSKVFEGLPTAGLPYQLKDWEQFEEYMETLISTRTIASIKEVWWDIRPHPDYGTIELRICDGLPTLREIGMVAALSQCLVDQLNAQIDKGYTLPMPKQWVVKENKWRATRYGMAAEIITEDRSVKPMYDAICELVEDLTPTAERLGCVKELTSIREVLDGNASYQRQRAVFDANDGDLRAVVDSLLTEMRTDTLTPIPDPPPHAAGTETADLPAAI